MYFARKIRTVALLLAGIALLGKAVAAQVSPSHAHHSHQADAAGLVATGQGGQDELGPKPLVPEGYELVHGDILVPTSAYAAAWVGTLWPMDAELEVMVIPYEFDANVTNPAWVTSALDAMNEWEDLANLDFRPRSTTSPEPQFIHFQNSIGNNSPLGMQSNGNIINVANWGNRWIICHEIAHTLGYRHEQSRPDRDQFVTINWGNIQAGSANNFAIDNDAGTYGPYDFDSVMHYSACAFSICCPAGTACACPANCTTIDVLPPNEDQWQSQIGQLDHLSNWDGVVMSFLYPEADWRFLDTSSNASSSGTFQQPFNGTLLGALGSTSDGGELIILTGDSFPATTITQPVTLRAPLGGVVIG